MILRNIYQKCHTVSARSSYVWSVCYGRWPCFITHITSTLQAGSSGCWYETTVPLLSKTRYVMPTNHTSITPQGYLSVSTKAKSPGRSDTPNGDDQEFVLDDEEFTEGSQDRKNCKSKGSANKVNVGDDILEDLNRLFDITGEEALLMVRHSHFLRVSDEAIRETLHFLKDHHITSEQLQRVPWILLKSADKLHQKFKKLTEPHMFKNWSDGVGFCHFSVKQIEFYQKYFMLEAADFPHHSNRLYYIAERLKVPVEQLTEKIIKPHKILLMKKTRLDYMLDIFHRYGVLPDDILSDLWVFFYNAKKVEERLQRACELGIHQPKPWMCRCPSKIFDRYCERFSTEKKLLGDHKDLVRYLSKKLQCEPEMAQKYLKSNHSLLRKIHISKLQRILDLLYSEGLSAEDVRSCIRVLQYSEERTAKRIRELKEIGYFPFPIIILCKTPAQFQKIVDLFREQKNNLKNETL